MQIIKERILIIICSILIGAAAWGALPTEWYTLNDDGTIWRGQKRVHTQAKPIEGVNYSWLMVAPSKNPEMEGSKRAVWIYNLDNLDHAPLYIPLKKGVECTEIYYDADNSAFNLVLSTGIVAKYDNSGELIGEVAVENFKRPGDNKEQEQILTPDNNNENEKDEKDDDEEDYDSFFK